MLHIAICDDEKNFVAYLSDMLNQYSAETGEEIRISPYYDGMELIEGYDTTIDLIFLDIQMKLLDGLKAAEHIRKLDEHVGIIFLTTMTQYGLKGYQYQAFNYIIKPMKYVRLRAEMDRWLKKYRRNDSPAITVSNDTGRYKIYLNSLRYVETFNRNLLLHTEQENIVCYKSMKDMERELAGLDFVRCHTSYLVNLSYVKGMKKLELHLTSGEIIPISQPKRKEFTQKLTEYWGDML